MTNLKKHKTIYHCQLIYADKSRLGKLNAKTRKKQLEDLCRGFRCKHYREDKPCYFRESFLRERR